MLYNQVAGDVLLLRRKRASVSFVVAVSSPILSSHSATTLLAMAFRVSHCPCASRFQRIAIFLTFYPGFESCLVNGQVEDLRPAEELAECRHHFRCGGKDNLVHGFRLSLRRVSIEIDPASIGAEHKHPFLWQRICWRHTRLSNQIRTAFATRAKIQDVCISIVISNRAHWRLLLWLPRCC